jgi:hypothetical protein
LSGDQILEGARFLVPVQSGPRAHPASCTGSLSLGVKQPGHGIDHLPPYSPKDKERVELYPTALLAVHGPF